MRLGLGLGFSGGAFGPTNEAPTDILLSASSIAENNSVNAVVGALSVVDEGDGGPWTYDLVAGAGSADNASFNISGSNLRIGVVANYEVKSSYSVRIQATDQGELTFEKQFTISITNVNEAPTNISLSNASVPEDLAVGLSVGTLSTTDPDSGNTFTYTITVDADNKFDISGDQLIIGHALDYETKTSHDVTVRSTDQGGLYYEKTFTVAVTDVDESTAPDLPPDNGTLVYDGGFDVNPSANKHNGNLRLQGKNGGVAKFVFDIGAAVAGTKYTARVDPDFSLLSNSGKEAFVGFGFKEADNDFHFVGQKGDGSTGYHKYKISGAAKFNNNSGFTTSDGGSAANGTQAGPNWIQIEISGDGATYTYRTSSDGSSWTDEYSGSSPSPCANATTATFGIAVFLENSDKGQFSIDVTVWSAQEPKSQSFTDSAVEFTTTKSVFTFTGKSIGTASASRRVAVFACGASGAASRTVSGITVGGTALSFVGRKDNGAGVTVELWMGLVASGTSADIVVTWNNTQVFMGIGVFATYGLANNTPVDTDNWLPTDGGGTNVTIDTVNGGFALAGVIVLGSSPADSIWTTITERYDQTLATTWKQSGASIATSGTSLTFNHVATTGGNSNVAGFCASF